MSNFRPPADNPGADTEQVETPAQEMLGEALARAGPLPAPANLSAEMLSNAEHLGAPSGLLAASAETRGARVRRLVRPIAGFFGAQILVQLLALLAGLLVVRTMPKTEYAFYTLANAVQGALSMLTDLGAGNAVMALGGRVWQDRQELGQLLQTALGIRKIFQVGLAFLVGPGLLWLLRSHDCPWLAALVITAGIVATVYYQVSAAVFTVVPRLHAQLGVLQNIDLLSNGFRLALLGLLFGLGTLFFNATIVTLIGLATFMVQTNLSRRAAAINADLAQSPSPKQRVAIFGVVRQEAPVAVYAALQGQVTIWVISLFGTTQTIAEVGALSRIFLLLGVFSPLLSNVVVPRFARCQDLPRLKLIYWSALGAAAALGALFLVLSLLFPQPFLWLLGPKYANLQAELPFMVFAAGANLVGAVLTSLLAARAWVSRFWLAIPISICAQIALLPLLDLSSIRDVILLSCLPPIATWALYLCQARISFGEFAAQKQRDQAA